MRRLLPLICGVVLVVAVSPPAGAQHTGPLPPAEKPKMEAPPIPAEEIVRKFAAKEAEFKQARDEYSYKQVVVVREYDESGRPGGEFRRNSEVIFLDNGERYERVTREPPITLKRISITPEDVHDLESIQPFVLTTEELPEYSVEYQGKEKIDELTTFVFSVRPKKIEKKRRYFQGTVWVDDQDFQIVKTRGKAVPDIREGGQENLFPAFETYRENVDGKYWFPTYTSANDVLAFSNGPVRIQVLVRYTDYKRRAVTTRIIGAEPTEPSEKKPPEKKPPQ